MNSARLPFVFSLLVTAASVAAQNQNPVWQLGVPLPQGRSDINAAIDSLGRIVVPGGNINPTPPYATNTCVAFDETQQQWVPIPEMFTERSGCGVVSDYLGRVYAIGGFTNDTSPHTASCERFDSSATVPQWQSIAPLPEPLGYVRAVASPDGRSIYAAGGQTPTGGSNAVYRYDVLQDQWHLEPPALLEHGQGPGSIAMTPSGVIYLTGTAGIWPEHLHLQRRDPLTKQWTDLGPTPLGGDQVSACVSDQFGEVFFCGGYNGWTGPTALSDVWRYSSRNDSWFQCGSLPAAINNMACVISNSSMLYLIGGNPGTGSIRLDTVYRAELDSRPGAAFDLFGEGCAGSVASVPTLTSAGVPILGQAFPMDIGLQQPGLSLVAGVIGFSNTQVGALALPLPLGELGMPNCLLYVSADIIDVFLTPGCCAWTLPIPSDTSAAGFEFYCQALVFDPTGTPVRLFGSNAGHATAGF